MCVCVFAPCNKKLQMRKKNAYLDYFAIKNVNQQALCKVSELYLLYIEFQSEKHSKVTEKLARNDTH